MVLSLVLIAVIWTGKRYVAVFVLAVIQLQPLMHGASVTCETSLWIVSTEIFATALNWTIQYQPGGRSGTQ